MIDLHCHLLPALDDGARDLEDALDMARQAETDGIAAVCATPHIRADHAVVPDELPERRATLAAALAQAGCAVQVLGGAEVAVEALPGLGEAVLAELTLGGGGGWVLLEPPPGPLEKSTARACHELHVRGLGVVLAHPERHGGPDFPARLRALVDDGVLIQATAAFFLDPRTCAGMRRLAELGLVHVLGSDAHSSRAGRPVVLTEAYAALAEIEPVARHLDWIAEEAPRAITRGKPVSPPF